MIRKLFIILILLASSSFAASGNKEPNKQIYWPFDGFFGTVDRASAQRGYQVYKEVCASCHSMRLLSYRNLAEIGFSEDEIKVLAAEATVTDGPNDDGEMFDRPGKPFDRFPSPYPNENAARLANNGAYPPDLSLIVKARPDGANYLYSLLTGYHEAPSGFELGEGQYYNPYMENKAIAMPAPLSEGLVSYEDETPATIDQMSKDVTVFLQWAAEPEMEKRKRMGLKTILFLLVFTAFFYLAKKRIWSNVHNEK